MIPEEISGSDKDFDTNSSSTFHEAGSQKSGNGYTFVQTPNVALQAEKCWSKPVTKTKNQNLPDIALRCSHSNPLSNCHSKDGPHYKCRAFALPTDKKQQPDVEDIDASDVDSVFSTQPSVISVSTSHFADNPACSCKLSPSLKEPTCYRCSGNSNGLKLSLVKQMITELVNLLEDTNQTLQNVKQDGDSRSLCSVLLHISTEIAHNTQQNNRNGSMASSIQAASVHSTDGTDYRLGDREGST